MCTVIADWNTNAGIDSASPGIEPPAPEASCSAWPEGARARDLGAYTVVAFMRMHRIGAGASETGTRQRRNNGEIFPGIKRQFVMPTF